MIIDGRLIAREIEERLKNEIKNLASPPLLTAFIIGQDLAKKSFLKIKQQVAERIGIVAEIITLPDTFTTNQVRERIKIATSDHLVNGVIVQLPIPPHLDTERVLDSISQNKDPDVLSQTAKNMFFRGLSPIVPPVVAAIIEVAKREDISFKNKKILVIGKGRLVGEPVALWLRSLGIVPMIIDEFTDENKKSETIMAADIIISGAGKSGIITPDKIKHGVVIIDAGTSDVGGSLRGDALPSCVKKASLLTPVPGGLGPIVVAKLFENLLILAKKRDKMADT